MRQEFVKRKRSHKNTLLRIRLLNVLKTDLGDASLVFSALVNWSGFGNFRHYLGGKNKRG